MSDRDTNDEASAELEAWQLDVQIRNSVAAGQFELAIPLAERLLELREQALGPLHPDTIAIAATAGLCQIRLAPHGLDEKAIARCENNPAALVKLFWKFARVLVQKDELDKAERLASHAVRIGRKTFGEADIKLAPALATLATVEQSRGELARAAEHALKAFGIQTPHLETHPIDVYDGTMLLGDILAELEEHEEARKSYRLGLEIALRALNEDKRRMGEALFRYGCVALTEKQPELAVQPLKSTLEMWTEVLGTNHLELVGVLHRLRDAYVGVEYYDEAEEICDQLGEVYAAHYPAESSHGSLAIVLKADVATKRGDHARAASLLEEALVLAAKEFGEDNLRLQVILDRAAEARLAEGNLTRAKELSNRLLNVLLPNVKDDNDPALLPAVRKLAEIAIREAADVADVEEIKRLFEWVTRLIQRSTEQVEAETAKINAKLAREKAERESK